MPVVMCIHVLIRDNAVSMYIFTEARDFVHRKRTIENLEISASTIISRTNVLSIFLFLFFFPLLVISDLARSRRFQGSPIDRSTREPETNLSQENTVVEGFEIGIKRKPSGRVPSAIEALLVVSALQKRARHFDSSGRRRVCPN